jgi:hypothetical protein
MRKIEKKMWPGIFQDFLDGKKTFEVRLADWECKPGDTLVFREWDPKTKKYTGRKILKEVGYVYKTKDAKFFTKKEIDKYGFQVIAFK